MERQKILALLIIIISILMFSCNPIKPRLNPMKSETGYSTAYTSALTDLNTVLEVYLPPDYRTVYFYVKPITDATGISQQGGEIPPDITSLVRDAVSQVYYKIRYVEQYDQSDITHIQAEQMLRQSGKLQTETRGAVRPVADYTISGRISQFDRNLEASSTSAHAMGNFGEGISRTDISGSLETSSRLSRLSVSFQVYDSGGISIPGKFSATTEVGFAKNGIDIGFAIFGNGFGFGTQATAMHGRHEALQMMSELCVCQIIGRTLTIPYWRVGAVKKIFVEDRLVIDSWSKEYATMMSDGMIIPFMQSQCIANGDSSVSITGHLDSTTQAAFDRFAQKYGVNNRSYPNFELYKALESNRILNTDVSRQAWNAYLAFKGGARPTAQPSPAPVPVAKPAPTPAAKPAPAKAPSAEPAHEKRRPARPARTPDPTDPLRDLLP